MNKTLAGLLVLIALVSGGLWSGFHAESQETTQSYVPPKGFVPDEETAIAIAVAVWNPIYGKEQIAKQKPYRAVSGAGVWSVTGSLPPNKDGSPRVGGVAMAVIAKKDGQILQVLHEL